MKKICRAAAALLLLLSLSCTAPLFNEELTLISLASAKMVKQYGFSFWWDGPDLSDAVSLLPRLDSRAPSLGVVYYDSPQTGKIQFFVPNDIGPDHALGAPNNSFAYPLKGAVFGDGSEDFTRFVLSSEEGDDVFILGFNHLGNQVFRFSLRDLCAGLPSGGEINYPSKDKWTILGVHLAPHEDYRKLYFNIMALVDIGYPNSLSELSFLLNSDGTTEFLQNINWERFGTPYVSLGSNPGIEFSSMMGGYFYDSVKEQSYANFWTDSSYRSLCWNKDTFTDVVKIPELPIKEKILALLSTGEILTQDGMYGQVYDSRGRKKYRFLLGDLRFSYEIYRGGEDGQGGVPHLVFFRLTGFNEPYGHSGVQVFTVPTAKLNQLQR